MPTKRLTIKDLALMGMMTALIFVGKESLSFLPNIEVVSLLIILYTLTIGWRVLYVIYAFVLLQGLLYGFGLWFIMYLYVWTLLAAVIRLLRHTDSAIVFALVSGIYGLLFGALCAIPYFFIGGPSTVLAWWVAGIPYDLLHGGGNFIVCLLLYRPLRSIFKRIDKI